MKRIALLSLLLVPSVAGADQVHSTPYGGQGAVGAAVDQGYAQQPQSPLAMQSSYGAACPTTCRPCSTSGGWFGDVGFYVLRPQWSGSNPAFAADVNDNGVRTLQQFDFDHDYNFAPLVTIGYAGRNGLGVRGRWWTLRSEESLAGTFDAATPGLTADVFVPSLMGTGTGIQGQAGAGVLGGGADGTVSGGFRNRLDIDVIDIEGIWDTTVGRSSLLFSSGVRYAHIGQTYDADVEQTSTGAGAFDAAFRASNTFNGAGPTVAMQGYRLIGDTNLSLYGISRGSLLFGESRQRAFRDDSLGTDVSAALTSNSVLPILELEVGTNWSRNMGNYDLFMENGLVGMVWFNAGNAAGSDAILGGNTGTDNVNQNLGLIGLRFATGVRF